MVKSKQSPKGKGKNKQKEAKAAPLLSKQELAEQKRKAAKQRAELISAIGQAIGIGIVLGGIGFGVAGPLGGVGGFAAGVVLILSYKYPKFAIWAFLIYLPFSGTITYSLGGNALLQIAKDGFYIPAAIAVYQSCKRQRLPFLVPKGFLPWVYALLGYCLVIIFAVNGTQPSRGGSDQPILLGFMGLKVLMGYLPLIACAYHLIKTKKEFLALTRVHVILTIICCTLCFVQYTYLTSGRCDGTRYLEGAELFKASLEARCLFGGSLVYSPQVGMIRLPGTFVSPWHWAWFLIGNIFITFASAFSDPSFIWRMVGFVGMGGVYICAVISGQRIALALVPVITIILLVLTGQLTQLKRLLPIAIGLGGLIAVGFIMFPDLVQERIDSFIGRWKASPPTDFIADQAEFTAQNKGPLGNGLGRATNSARIFGKTLLIETWFPKILYEIGSPGLVLFLLLVTALTYFTFKAYRSVKEPNLRSFAACFWVFVLIISYQTYWYPLDTDPVCAYYWLFAGLIFRLPLIDKEEQLKAEAEALEEQNLLIKSGKKLKPQKGIKSKSSQKSKSSSRKR